MVLYHAAALWLAMATVQDPWIPFLEKIQPRPPLYFQVVPSIDHKCFHVRRLRISQIVATDTP